MENAPPINYTPLSTEIIGMVWTNTKPDGDITGMADCNGWTSSSSNYRGNYGYTATTISWTQVADDTCDQLKYLYCVEQ